jgi:predicted RNA methylase
MLALAGTTPDDVVFDLGCGDGRLVIAAARDYGARAVGVDADPTRIAEARANAAGLEARVTFLEADILDADVSQATVVCLYLEEAAYPVLADTVITRLRAGTRVVSHALSFAAWPPVRAEVVASGDYTASFVFVWQVPEA